MAYVGATAGGIAVVLVMFGLFWLYSWVCDHL